MSLDVESNGPAAGLNSMLALGAAAFSDDGEWITSFYSTLYPIPGSSPDPDTMKWWETQPEAWAEVTRNRLQPATVMREFTAWSESLTNFGRLTALGWSIVYDWQYVNWYLWRFVGRNPLGYDAMDIRSYASGLAAEPSYRGLTEKQVEELVGPVDKTGLRAHVAVDDAIGQGRLCMAFLRYARERRHQHLAEAAAAEIMADMAFEGRSGL